MINGSMSHMMNLYKQRFEALKVEPMTRDMSELLLQFLFMSKQGIPLPDEAKNSQAYMIMERRLACLEIEASDYAIAFMSLQARSPGDLVMFATDLLCSKVYQVDLDNICRTLFPLGFPTQEALTELWDWQKLPDGRNFVDQVYNADGPLFKQGYNDYVSEMVGDVSEPTTSMVNMSSLQQALYRAGYDKARREDKE